MAKVRRSPSVPVALKLEASGMRTVQRPPGPGLAGVTATCRITPVRKLQARDLDEDSTVLGETADLLKLGQRVCERANAIAAIEAPNSGPGLGIPYSSTGTSLTSLLTGTCSSRATRPRDG